MGIFSTAGLVVFYLLCVSSLICSDVCKQTGPCSCEFLNATGIDLSPAVPSKYYTANAYEMRWNGTLYELTTFYYHPCLDTNLNLTVPVEEENTCDFPLSICRHLNIMRRTENVATNTFVLDKGRYEILGKTNVSEFSEQGDYIKYFNGPALTIVLLKCTQTDNSFQVYSLKDPSRIVLAFYSPHACLKQMGGRSPGSTLLVISILLVTCSILIFCLVLGICVRKFWIGANGGVVGNLAFWSESPSLVKDGSMVSGFKAPSRSA